MTALALATLVACSSAPERPAPPAARPISGPGAYEARTAAATAAAGTAPAAAAAGSAAGAPGGAAGATSADNTPAAAPRPVAPAAARSDFDRAVSFMRAGNAVEAELGFKQLVLEYPQFAAPLVNLALLERKSGQLQQAEQSLKSAVARESGSAVAWTELGVTQRMRGEFKDALSSYEQAIAVDPHYAPAWRDLGVLSDLYMDNPQRALSALEEYKQLTGEEKPVSGWIAELRQRLGLPPVKRPTGAEPPMPHPEPPPPAASPANAAAPDSPPAAGG